MLASNLAIKVENLSKCYQIYGSPRDRLKQFVLPRLQRAVGKQTKKYYREFWALRDVSFDIRKGETVGIVGKNGAGKSTLLQMICGTLSATQGLIRAQGSITALLELGSGFNPSFTGRENVYLNGLILGLSTAEVDSKFEEIAAFAEIGDFIDQPVKTYSSGMYLRLAFAVQVCVNPDILIVDEALAVGDAYFVHRCFHRLRDMKARGKTILFVSHDTGSVKNLCDRAIWIDEGRLRMSGDPDEVTRQYRAHLFGINVKNRKPEVSSSTNTSNAMESPIKTSQAERHIPNFDRRLGDQSCRLFGVGMYDPATLEGITEIKSGGDFILRMSFLNESLEPGSSLVVGYALRSPKGEEIGAVNSEMEKMEVLAPITGEVVTVRAHISLPIIQQGNYALTIAIATAKKAGLEPIDRVENALVFCVTASTSVIGLIRFPTVFTVE